MQKYVFVIKHLIKISFLLIYLSFILPQLHGQTINNIGKPFIKNYLPEEYGSHPQNWAAIQDNDGIMYFGNNEGVLEFDGETWRTTKLYDIRAFFKDSAGII